MRRACHRERLGRSAATALQRQHLHAPKRCMNARTGNVLQGLLRVVQAIRPGRESWLGAAGHCTVLEGLVARL